MLSYSNMGPIIKRTKKKLFGEYHISFSIIKEAFWTMGYFDLVAIFLDYPFMYFTFTSL